MADGRNKVSSRKNILQSDKVFKQFLSLKRLNANVNIAITQKCREMKHTISSEQSSPILENYLQTSKTLVNCVAGDEFDLLFWM